MSSTSEELASQAEGLQTTMAFFKIDDAGLGGNARVTQQNKPTKTAAQVAHMGAKGRNPGSAAARGAKTQAPIKRKGSDSSGSGYALEMNTKAEKDEDGFEKY
jgi:methyl-accepting chemotaxis protein